MSDTIKYERSIVVPVFNGMRFLPEFWSRLLKVMPDSSEIIIVNDGSFEPVESTFPDSSDHYRVHIMNNMINVGYASSVNIGVEESSSEIIHVLNTDIFLVSDVFTANENYLKKESKIGIVGIPLYYPQNERCQHYGMAFTSRRKFLVYRNCPANLVPKNLTNKRQAVTFACATTTKSLWDKLNGLDERFYNRNEDIDFCLRAAKLGYESILQDKKYAYHWESVSGTPRFALDADNEAHFWGNWSKEVTTDINYYLKMSLIDALKRNSTRIKRTARLINLARFVVDDSIINTLKENLDLSLPEINRPQRFRNNQMVHLSMSLPYELGEEDTPMIYLIDEWPWLQENLLWFKNRNKIVGDELIIDLYANVLWASEVFQL